MATTTKSQSKPAPTREALAESVPTVNMGIIARDLVASFTAEQQSSKERVFEQARITAAAKASGASDEKIAEATTEAMLATFPEADRKYAATLSVTDGGASVTRVTIKQRRQAWEDLVEAGVTPTVDTVDAAFKVATKGLKGLAELRTKLAADTKKQPANRRATYYIAQSRIRVANLAKAVAEAKAEAAATKAANAKAETPEVDAEVILESAEDFIAYVKATLERPWSDDDRALIIAALTEAVSAA